MSSLVGMLDSRLSSLSIWIGLLIYVLTLLVIVALAYWRKWLTESGLVAAFILGLFILYLGGFSAFIILLFFFIAGSLLGKAVKSMNLVEKKGDRRDCFQVLANGVPALIGLILYHYSGYPIAGLIAFSSALSEALADTSSGDIGRLSDKAPVSIIAFTPVPKGISGGVTVLGFLGGLVAAFLVALIHIGTYPYSMLSSFFLVSGCGFLGSILDSILGATIQVHYRDKSGKLTEKSEIDGVKLERVRGIPFVDNDMVTFISGLFSMTLAFMLSIVIL